MVQKANTVFRDYVTDGVPSSGDNDPDKAEIRKWGTYLESGVAGAAAGATIYDSKSDMDADTSQAANAMAWVLGDDTAANNGVYQFDGTSTWTRLGDLPHSYITAVNGGAGTADAIVATTSIPVPDADDAALIALPIVADNTSATVTVAFNGGDALTIKTNAGNSPAVGGLKDGMVVAGYVSDTTFRLLSDQASSAIQTAAEAAQAAAEAARDTTLAAVPAAYPVSRTALRAVDTDTQTVAYLLESGRAGQFQWNASDLSATLLGSDITTTAVDATDNILTKADHGLRLGNAVVATSAANGLSTKTLYYVIGLDTDVIYYESESAAFTKGETLTGGTSAATATIAKVVDNGTTGILWLTDVTGTFQADETITDSATGSATASGANTTLLNTDQFKLAASYANAHAGTAVDLTGTTNFTLKQHFDPQEGLFICPTADLTGASGAWKRLLDGNINPTWFGADPTGADSSSQALQGADDALNLGRRLYIPDGEYLFEEQVSKNPATWWSGPGGTVQIATSRENIANFVCGFDGNMVDIFGAAQSKAGGIEGVRFDGDNDTYPKSRAINLLKVFTHTFKDIRIGGFDYGLYGLDCHALISENLYIFDCLTDGGFLEGTSQTANTDHRFFDCQFTGDNFGLHGKNGATFRLTSCRPQSSGVANLCLDKVRDSKVEGGFCDSAIQNAATGGGDGIRVINCIDLIINAVTFYSNGNASSVAKANINIFASDAGCTDLTISNCIMLESALAPMRGINFNSPSGDGFIRRVAITGNNLNGMSVELNGLDHIDSELRLTGNINPANAAYVAAAGPTTDQALAPEVEVYRIVGTLNTSFNVNLAAPGNYAGKRVKIVRASGGAGTVSIIGPNGTTVGTLTAAGSLEVICVTSSSTATSVAYAAI